MPTTDPERAALHVHQLAHLHRTAAVRAARPPVIEEWAWRGPAYSAYRLRAGMAAADLERLAARLGRAVALAREEHARALG